jgi:hypothetical protein
MAKHALAISNPQARSQIDVEQWIGAIVMKLNEREQ